MLDPDILAWPPCMHGYNPTHPPCTSLKTHSSDEANLVKEPMFSKDSRACTLNHSARM